MDREQQQLAQAAREWESLLDLADIGHPQVERMMADRERVVAEHATVADRIRALNTLGYRRTDIAAMLGKSYQHVRNVLVADAQTSRRPPEPPLAEPAPRSSGPDAFVRGDTVRLNVRPDGSVLLPPEVLERLETRAGGMLIGTLEDGEMMLRGPHASLRYVRTMVDPWKPGEPLASDELIAERREEERREIGGG